MGSYTIVEYVQVLAKLEHYSSIIPGKWLHTLAQYESTIFRSDLQNRYGKPMPWIGMYIALASVVCILAMVGDLLHSLRNKKLWFPCKYFTLNAASLSVIAVAVKLPMDLNNPMPGEADQAAKLGSLAFMCTLMANSLPSLASMDNKELLTNIIALVVLVITLVVNVCIQIKTGVVSYPEADQFSNIALNWHIERLVSKMYFYRNRVIAIIYVAMILLLLIIHTCSDLAILKSKHILESKYQASHEIALKDPELQQLERLDVKKLKKHVSNYWIMAETGSPQFMIVCSATTSASGVVCALSTILLITIILYTFRFITAHDSDYKRSIPVIFITQSIGVILGTIAPLCRCFSSLNFKLSIEWIWDHIKVFKVERYWTQKLSGWKHSSIPFQIRSRECRVVIENSKVLILGFCIVFQKIVVVTCKTIALIPIFFTPCVLFCLHCWKWLKVMVSASGLVLKENEQDQHKKDLRKYVLQLHDDMEPAERTLKGILKSMNRIIKKAEKQKPKNLMKLLAESTSFEGVGNFDNYHLSPVLSKEYPHCWSLPVVNLTTIASSLPNVSNNKVENLLRSVNEGLSYITIVEESLNATDEYVRVQKAAKQLWIEVEVHKKWLGKKVKEADPLMKSTGQILEWFNDTSKSIVTDVESMNTQDSNENTFCMGVGADSMYRITQTILLSYQDKIEQVSQEQLFDRLSSMISDILAACLTNLPQVIATKCHTNAIETREASVHAAAQLLGEAKEIINILQDRELPRLESDKFPFIDEWRAYFTQPLLIIE